MNLQHGAYILARFSTEHQEADSIEVQVRKCREWCDRERLPVLGVFADEAVSGMKETRPEYQRMMSMLALGGADTVVIYDQSRMFRKMTLWFEFRDTVAKYGVRVVSVTQPLVGGDLRDPANFLTEGSMALFNQMWVLQTRQKVIEKMRFMAAQGRHTGGTPPLGYDVVDGALQINQDEAETVRSIFRDYAAGKRYREIIERLNSEGKRTKAGNSFGLNSLHDLLKNEKYIGVITYGKVEKRADGSRNSHVAAENIIRLENMLPAIVDRETWEVVQKKMESNKKDHSGRPASRREYPLKGKVFCYECKAALSLEHSRGKYFYYACESDKRKGQPGRHVRIEVNDLEQTVANAIRERYTMPGSLDALIEILRMQRRNVDAEATAKLKKLMSRKDAVNKQLDAATNAVLAGTLSNTLVEKINGLEKEKAQIEQDMLVLRSQVSGAEISEARVRELLQIAMSDLQALLSLVVRVEVAKDKIIVWTLLDADPNGQFDFTESGIDVAMCYDNSTCPSTGTKNYNNITLVSGLLCFSIKRTGRGH
jgi:site-specific DNA recombinase